jgi:GR25 family glycosyltransferase involved in LPS biosynthesis
MKTYVAHYTKLKERKEYILDQLNKIGASDVEFMEDYDKEVLTQDLIDRYYEADQAKFEQVAKITKDKCGGGEYRILKDSEISLMIKHVEILKKLSNSDNKYAMILEDDCLFLNDYSEEMIEILINSCVPDWDVIVIGGAFDHSICTYRDRYCMFLLANHPATNTTSSMIFKKETASKILETFQKFHISWDWQLNHIFYVNDFKVYHTFPYICKQNNFKTSIQN